MADGVVNGFVGRENLRVLSSAILQAAASALTSEILTAWPMNSPPLILALFENRSAFDGEAARLAGFAASGAMVIVGCPGSLKDIDPALHGVDLRECDDLSDAWGLLVIETTFVAALIAVRSDGLSRSLRSGMEKRRVPIYSAKWTFRRDRAEVAAAQIFRPLRSLLDPPIAIAVDRTIAKLGESLPTDGESRLLEILDVIGQRLVSSPLLAVFGSPSD